MDDFDVAVDKTPFMTAASILVDKISGLSTEVLTVIETWLAAHFYCMHSPRRVTEKAGDVGATYETKIGFNLALSKYGQMAMTLDTTGTLRGISSGTVKPRLVWLGTDPCELR